MGRSWHSNTLQTEIDKTEHKGFTWVTPDDLGRLRSRYVTDSARRITEEGYRSCGTTMAPANSLAISTRAPIGHLGILQSKGCVNQGCRLLIPGASIQVEYLHYTLSTSRSDLASLEQGSTFTELSRTQLSAFRFPLPLPHEQAAIVRYLDHVDRRIRRYVNAKRKLIALLEEEKQAIVNRAVTRGLDPNVRLKPSGVEWPGDVPEHWEVRRLKTICGMKSGEGITAESIEAAGEYPVYGGNGLRGYASSYTHDGAFALIGRQGALCGNVHISRGQFWASEHAVVAALDVGHEIDWFGAILTAINLNQYSIAAAQPGLAVERILNLYLPVPHLQEQKNIANHIEGATADIVAAIARARRQMELVQEYRTRLIADVVTGKLDVREAAAQLPDEADDQDPIGETAPLVDGLPGELPLRHRRVGRRFGNGRGGDRMTDWSKCPAVESVPGKVSGAWVFKDTRLPVSALFGNLAEGATVHDFIEWFGGVDEAQVRAVLEFIVQDLDAKVAKVSHANPV